MADINEHSNVGTVNFNCIYDPSKDFKCLNCAEMEGKLNAVCMELNAVKMIRNLLQKEFINISSYLTSRDVKHTTNKVLNEIRAPSREWYMVVCKSSHGFMKPAKTILPHTVQPILTLRLPD